MTQEEYIDSKVKTMSDLNGKKSKVLMFKNETEINNFKKQLALCNVGWRSEQLPDFDVQEINEILDDCKEKQEDFTALICRIWNKAYMTAINDERWHLKTKIKMENKFKTPKIDTQNVISFTCSDDSIEPLLELFEKLRSLGQMGSSRDVSIDWDGDGRDRLENISINGMTLDNWEKEWKRLEDIRKNYKTQSEPQNERGENER